jgi:hypothetical protein
MTPPATIANLLSDPSLVYLERMYSGAQYRRICAWADSNIGDRDHAEQCDNRKQ